MGTVVLAAEIGGTKLQAALGTPDGAILASERGAAPVEGGAAAIVGWFAEPMARLIARAKSEGKKTTGIGVGFGGPVDSAAGTVLVSHQVAGWDGFPLKAWFENAFHLPVTIANDSNAAGWAEYCVGAGKGTRHFAYTNIGSGIGGAIVMDGRLHDGQGFGAGELGHTYVPDWTSGAAGTPNKLENLCSGWSIEKRLRAAAPPPGSPLAQLCAGGPQNITCGMLGEAARLGDPLALEEIDRVAQSVAVALCNLIALFHPERIALGGGVSLLGGVLLDPICRHVDARVFGPFRNRYEIVPCALGESVVVVGGLLLAPRTCY